jgi:branched-chain amino acid transport system ATP-binding protein
MQLLEVREISKNFGGLQVIDQFSMLVSQGEIRALIGPNGAGKTTLFNIISGILSASSGSVFFGGREITLLRPNQIATLGISRTFQISKLFGEMTVLENVLIGMHTKYIYNFWANALPLPAARRDERRKREKAIEYLAMVDLESKADVEARALPHGDRQLLQIARALSNEPKLMMLDEPASGLNETEAKALMKVVRQTKDLGVTIVLVDHDMKFVMGLSEYITVLDRGKKIAEGPPDKISVNEEVIQAYLGKECLLGA